MRMYCAKQRARVPLSTVWPATVQVGKLTFFRPALVASPLIAAGVMSGVPATASALRFELTVLRPLKPITIVTIPNATRTTAAAYPPHSRTFLVVSDLNISSLLLGACDVSHARRGRAVVHQRRGRSSLRGSRTGSGSPPQRPERVK